jgi:Flp pilus assembly protein TadG
VSNYKSNHKKKFLAQKGQVVVIIALLMVCLMGMAALVVDVGSLYQKRASFQTVADSAALAGAQELPGNPENPAYAIQAAIDYAKIYYNVDIMPEDVEISKTSSPYYNTIKVTISDPAPVYFAGVLGINTVDVGASATAMVGEPQVYNVVPWAFFIPVGTPWDYSLLEPGVNKTIATYPATPLVSNFCAWDSQSSSSEWQTRYRNRIRYGYSFSLSVGGTIGPIWLRAINDTAQNMTQTVTYTTTRIGADLNWTNLDSFDTLTYTTVDGVIKLAKSGDTQLVIVPVVYRPTGVPQQTTTILAFAPFIILGKTGVGNNQRIIGKFIHQALIVYEGEVVGVKPAGLRVIRLIR